MVNLAVRVPYVPSVKGGYTSRRCDLQVLSVEDAEFLAGIRQGMEQATDAEKYGLSISHGRVVKYLFSLLRESLSKQRTT